MGLGGEDVLIDRHHQVFLLREQQIQVLKSLCQHKRIQPDGEKKLLIIKALIHVMEHLIFL